MKFSTARYWPKIGKTRIELTTGSGSSSNNQFSNFEALSFMEDFGWDVAPPETLTTAKPEAIGWYLTTSIHHIVLGNIFGCSPGSQKKIPNKNTSLSFNIQSEFKTIFPKLNCIITHTHTHTHTHTPPFTVQPLKTTQSHLYLQTSHFEVGPYYLPCKIVPAFAFLKRPPPLTPWMFATTFLQNHLVVDRSIHQDFHLGHQREILPVQFRFRDRAFNIFTFQSFWVWYWKKTKLWYTPEE